MTAARTGGCPQRRGAAAGGRHGGYAGATKRQTALMWAAAEGHAEVIRRLLDGGPASARAALVVTLPCCLCRSGKVDAARVLLAAGATLTEAAPDGKTPLIVAAASGHQEFDGVSAGPGSRPGSGGQRRLHRPPRCRVGTSRQPEMIKRLVAHRASLNARLTAPPPRPLKW